MVNVRLDQDWTDDDNVHHAAGETVDVDPGTLAQLEANGIVASREGADDVDVDPMTIGPGSTVAATIGPGGALAATIGPGGALAATIGPGGASEATIGPGGSGDDTIGPGEPGDPGDDSGSGGLGGGIVVDPMTIGPGRVERD
ncbi:MAG TPA: hypothetical protein VFR67_20285 [Pilimelia sp.]|nr:hypothetical protein [Pilimelia sp.]